MRRLLISILIALAVTGCTPATNTTDTAPESVAPSAGTTGSVPEAVAGEGTTDTITVSVAELAPGEVMCVGSFDLNEKKIYYDVAAETGSKLFVGLHRDGNLLSGDGVLWDKWTAGYILPFTGDERSVNVSEGIGGHEGIYYVYVGCEADGETLSNIAGTITYGD